MNTQNKTLPITEEFNTKTFILLTVLELNSSLCLHPPPLNQRHYHGAHTLHHQSGHPHRSPEGALRHGSRLVYPDELWVLHRHPSAVRRRSLLHQGTVVVVVVVVGMRDWCRIRWSGLVCGMDREWSVW